MTNLIIHFLSRVPFDRIKKLLLQFAQIDRNKDGLISAEDLSHFLNITNDICCSALFDKLDKVRLIKNILLQLPIYIFLSLIRITMD